MGGKEFWIWTELLAFDNTQADLGVGEYLQKVGICPDGIALMIGHPDFVYMYNGMAEEYPLLKACCSRHGHERNTLRHRQDWTNFQLRELVARLQRAGTRVFLSLFNQYLGNRLHEEWSSQFHEPLFCDVFPDGRDFTDFFIENLRKVMLDYGFDGWHGADGTAGDRRISVCCQMIRQELFGRFMEYAGLELSAVPEEYRVIDNHDYEARQKRSAWIWANHRRAWQDFISGRWTKFQIEVTEMLHGIGRLHMQNSCWAKSAFETWFYFGMDTRDLRKAGIDYLLLESVATSASLIYGTKEHPCRDHEIFSCEEELAAALPGVKVISMAGVCDPVESFNSLRHAPNMLERDIYCCANQSILTKDGEKRCANGMLVCLGDNLRAEDWQKLRGYFEQAYGFACHGSEGYVWLYCDEIYDRLRDAYPQYGTLSPYRQVSELALRAVMLPCVCRAENLSAAEGRPLLVPDYELLPEDVYRQVIARKGVTVLMGDVSCGRLPAGAVVAVETETLNGYKLGMVILNGKASTETKKVAAVLQHFDMDEQFDYVGDSIPYMQVNPDFWNACAERMRQEVFHPFTGPGFALIQHVAGGCRRIAIGSECDRYFIPEFTFERVAGQEIRLVSDYVCTDPVITEQGKLSGSNARGVYNHIYVPPRGVFVFEEEEKSNR